MSVRLGISAKELQMLEMDSRYALRHVLDVLAHYAGYPPVNIQKAIENGHLSLNFPLKMMIFHSYVSLPEGTSNGKWEIDFKWRCFFAKIIELNGRLPQLS